MSSEVKTRKKVGNAKRTVLVTSAYRGVQFSVYFINGLQTTWYEISYAIDGITDTFTDYISLFQADAIKKFKVHLDKILDEEIENAVENRVMVPMITPTSEEVIAEPEEIAKQPPRKPR